MANARQFMAARTAAWAKSGAPLPYDAEVEYLERGYNTSSGFGTEFSKWEKYKLYADFMPVSSGTTCRICGSMDSLGRGFDLRLNNGADVRVGYSSIKIYDFVFGKRLKVNIDVDTYKYSVDDDGLITSGDFTSSNKIACVENIILCNTGRFGFNYPGYENMICRFYGFKIFDADNVLLADMVPVRVGSEGCLYNRLGVGGMNADWTPRTDGIYHNTGVEPFTIGPDKTT